MANYIIIAGLPGSGKTSLAHQLEIRYEAVFLTSDSYKHTETGKDGEQIIVTDYEQMKKDADDLLEKETSVVLMASNLTEKRRRFLLKDVSGFRHKRICYLTLREYSACMRELEERGSTIALTLQDSLYRSFETPYYCECWDEIHLVYPDRNETSKGKSEGYYRNFLNYNQDNPHHLESLGEHLKMTGDKLLSTGDPELITAGYLHDIGKPFARTYGEPGEDGVRIAHYFGHAGIGAYESLFFDMEGLDKLRISGLISQHMKPLDGRRSGSKNGAEKAKRRWGEDLFYEVKLLSEADESSKIKSPEVL